MCLRLFWAVERSERVVNLKHEYDDVVIVVDCCDVNNIIGHVFYTSCWDEVIRVRYYHHCWLHLSSHITV